MSSYLVRCPARVRMFETTTHGLLENIITPISIFWQCAKPAHMILQRSSLLNVENMVLTCWCVPVIPQKPEAKQVRCIYCEYEGNRIVHPAVESFFGRNDFEKFYESGTSYTNDKLIEDHEIDVDWVHGVEEDAIYHLCYPDPDDIDDEELSIC
uniref:Uncharacterized protein n=1 Tax=Aegilops tauschii subsp. strangulata TaxID=200361 RepID=A0A453RJI4_AEGTS